MPERDRNGKDRRAIALRYQQEVDAAPRVIAKGQGLLAERILELAEEAGVPVSEDPSLVEVLVKLDLNTLVPPEMYQVLAEIFAWAYQQDRSYRSGRSGFRR